MRFKRYVYLIISESTLLEILYSYGILRSYSYEFLEFCVFILVIKEDILTDYNDKIFLLLW